MAEKWVRNAVLIAVMGGSATATAANYPVAGVKPDRRPAGAPVISEVAHEAAWFQRALTGVTRPYPYSLKFLDDQGGWYTPFNRAGMTGKYDLRGWHTAPAPQK